MKTPPVLLPPMLLGCLLVTVRWTFAAEPHGPASTKPTFSPAHLTEEGLCFESPVEVNWEAVARRELADSTIANPPTDQLERLWATGVLTFARDLPASLRSTSFYILSEAGVVEAPAPHLSVSVLYDITSKRTDPPTLRAFAGELCVKPPPSGVSDAGFVVSSALPLELHTTQAWTTRSGEDVLVRVADKITVLPRSTSPSVAVEVKTAYVLEVSGSSTRHLFVRRVASCLEPCCEFAYDLYRWDVGLTEVATSAYGCDV